MLYNKTATDKLFSNSV